MNVLWKRVVCCALVVLAVASAGYAAPLLPGATTLAPAEPDPAGGAVLASSTVPFASAYFSGSLTSTVIAGDASNPLGGLTFTYQLRSEAASLHPVNRFTVVSFGGWLIDASYQAPGQAPSLMDRSAAGDMVGYSFIGTPLGLGTLLPGAGSALLVVQTNAPAFAPGAASVINGSVAGNIPTYVPVPEPLTVALLAVGGLWACRRRA